MNSALTPAIGVKLVFRAAAAVGPAVLEEVVRQGFLSGGEDMPDAFRAIPTAVAELVHSLVAARDPQTRELMFFQLYAALFGFESAVYAFGRWSAFLEACGRRIGQLLWAMCVDDGNLLDGASAKGSGQALIGEIFKLLGASLSSDKRTPMALENEYLGLAHSLAEVATDHCMTFWPCEGLIAELKNMLQEVKQMCPPRPSIQV